MHVLEAGARGAGAAEVSCQHVKAKDDVLLRGLEQAAVRVRRSHRQPGGGGTPLAAGAALAHGVHPAPTPPRRHALGASSYASVDAGGDVSAVACSTEGSSGEPGQHPSVDLPPPTSAQTALSAALYYLL